MRFPDYPGHFPGNPLVPGAALLEEVARILGLDGFERVRFLVVVRPGDVLEVRGGTEGERCHFGVWRGETEVMRGIGLRRRPRTG